MSHPHRSTPPAGILDHATARQLRAFLSEADTFVFAVMRNEMLRLPAWLAHYRALGIAKIVVVDNGSTDGTLQRLREDDVFVVETAQSYGQSGFGMAWLSEVLGESRAGSIVINVDADELLIYEGWPNADFASYIADFRRSDCDTVFGFMLDMYPQDPDGLCADTIGTDLFAAAPLHDGDYVFRNTPLRPWHKQATRGIEVLGGPRTRMLSSLERQARSTWVDYMIQGQIDRLIHRVPPRWVKPVVKAFPTQLPALSKYPVFKSSGQPLGNVHMASGRRTYPRNVVLCHFKFLPDFAKKAAVEAQRGEHFRRGAEYIMYEDGLKRLEKGDLRYPGSVHFSPEALVARGLLRDISEFL